MKTLPPAPKDGKAPPSITTVYFNDIKETPENWTIYRKPDENDPAGIELCASIREKGILNPLEVSADGFIISGHRRYIAAVCVGVLQIPVIVDHDVQIGPMSAPERIALLTERNRGIRVKTDGELYLEAAAAVDPEAAVRKAQARKNQVFAKAKKSGMAEVEISGSISRTDPSGERKEMLKAVLDILAEKRANNYLATSGRHIHYSLLQKNVPTSTRSNGYIYGKPPVRYDKDGKKVPDGSSGLLSKLLTDARSAGLIDHGDIKDDTRPSVTFNPSGTVADYINKELDQLFTNYFSDVHADQPNHVELIVEKNTVFDLLTDNVARTFRVPITSGHGYSSFPSGSSISKRFTASGKDKLVVIYVSDFDPEGLDMPASWKKYMAHDFGVDPEVYRAAVTAEQIKKHNLPPDADVKLSSTRASGFIAKNGDQCWELDSMPEHVLIDEVSKAVRAVLDIGIFNAAMEREREADIKLARIQAAVRAFVTDKFREELAA